MTKKVRKMSMALETYLNDVNEEDISTDQDVQRVFCQDKKFVDELVITVLTEDCQVNQKKNYIHGRNLQQPVCQLEELEITPLERFL